ncbi:MAG: hypothetical protein LLF92_01825 [Planctomycetaceae bacterium]|nr:hypothetical protein [Planctomycetaceae bacterium]
MNTVKNWFKNLTVFQILVSGYALITIIGAILLSLPIASTSGEHQPFLDALFISASGISTSGLTTVDIGSYYSKFGQIVLLCIFQIGGIGYMTFIISLAYMLKMRLPIIAKAVAQESISGPDFRTLGRFFISVLAFTFFFELAGAIALAMLWKKDFPTSHAIYLGIFHSISAFCTAGFGLFSDSLMKYKSSITMNITIDILSIIGGIGFIVLYDFCSYISKMVKHQRPRRLSIHSKLIIIVSTLIMLLGTIIILFAEEWPSDMSFKEKLMLSSFQSISASTTDGFNSVDVSAMNPRSLTYIMFLMFVGASPGSTGGGIKTSTLGLIIVFLWSHLRNTKTDISIFERRIVPELIYRAFSVFSWFILIITADVIILSATEKTSYLHTLFEIVSALGNTGLSMGITSGLSPVGKVILTITMFIGRIGPLAAGFFLIGRQRPVLYEYPAETVFVG